jgi:hypothetical protein
LKTGSLRRQRGHGMAIPKRRLWAVAITVALGTIGATWAQDQVGNAPAPAAKSKAPAKKGGLRAGGGAAPKTKRPNGSDPLTGRAVGAEGAALPEWPYHWKLKLIGLDNVPIAASYYPSQLGPNAPVILLVHEKGHGRSSKDFEDPIDDIKGQSFAEHLQEQDFAVLLLDLRGHGGNPRHEVSARQWQSMGNDLQTAYYFLVDRNNRRELNIAKLGVLGLGDAANLAATWVAQSGGVASEGRVSDVGALALLSPVDDAQGLRLSPTIGLLAPRVPIAVLVGQKDALSINAVRDTKPIVERQQRSKVVQFDTTLHGYKLLRLVPKVVEPIDNFFKETIKIRLIDWEPRYLLSPTGVSNIELVSKKGPSNPSTPATKKDAAKKDAAEAPKKEAADAPKKDAAEEPKKDAADAPKTKADN